MPYSKERPKPISAKLKEKLRDMIRRCENPHRRSYKDYGARGIYVCDEWKTDRNAFVKWSLANGYEPGLSIDRIDNNGPYAPWNCRYVNTKAQQNNKTTNVKFTVDGVCATIAQWAVLINRPTEVLYDLRYECDEDLQWYLDTRWGRLSAMEKKLSLNKIDYQDGS